MNSIREFKKGLEQTPPAGCPFKVGDTVTFTNEYGVSFPGLKVIGFDTADPYWNGKRGKYIHIDSEAYWFPKSPDELKKD